VSGNRLQQVEQMKRFSTTKKLKMKRTRISRMRTRTKTKR
jgi:hypothetical protein